MTTGATGQLGLALPVQGELSGTWGDTVNNGLTQYINIAIAGTLTLTGDGAVTLANTTGDASASNVTSTLTGAGTVTAQFAIVRVTGTLTTAKVVTAPSYSKTYTVVNAATGGIVTFKASGQTGVSIAVGESAFVYFNGTDYVKVSGTASVTSFSAGTTGLTPSTSTTGAVTLAGTLAIANGGTGQTTANTALNALLPSQTGNANKYLQTDGTNSSWDAVSLSTADITGTLGTANGGTGLTSFTSGGVVYASSTSALATGSALTFDGTNLTNTTGYISAATDFRLAGNSYSRVAVLNPLGGGFVGGYNITYSSGVKYDSAGSVTGIYYNNNQTIEFYVGGGGAAGAAAPEAMRLTSTGLGIGTSSPATKLDVSGVISLQGTTLPTAGTARILSRSSDSSFYIQTATGGSFYLLDGSQNSMYAARSTSHEWATNNTTKMTLDSAGNLGLGVTPSAWNSGTQALQIGSGSAIWNPGSVNQTWVMANSYYDQTDNRFEFISSGTAGAYAIVGNTHQWNISTGTTGANNPTTFTQAMTLDASGNLRIGDTTGNGRLSVRDSSAALQEIYTTAGTNYATLEVKNTGGSFYIGRDNSAGSFFVSNTAYASCLYSSGAYPMVFFTNGTERMRLDSAGNLGLGVTPVSQNGKVFHIDGGAGAADIRLTNTATGSAVNNGGLLTLSGSDIYFWNLENNILSFGTNNAERARIDSSGNLLVGTTSAFGTVGASTGFQATQGGAIYASSNDDSYFAKRGSDGATITFRRDTTTVGSISLTTTGTAYNTSSDYRLKNTIAPMTGALAKVALLKPCTYKWNVNGSDGEGFIAHELAEVCPQAVVGEKDAVDADGNPKYQGIDTSFLVATVVAALQELKAEFDAYKASHP